MWLFCVFFFKQKTTYEVRISDWSSDVCSSDLYLLFCAALACSYKASACLSAALRIDRDCSSKASARLSAASRIDLAFSSTRVAFISPCRSRFLPSPFFASPSPSPPFFSSSSPLSPPSPLLSFFPLPLFLFPLSFPFPFSFFFSLFFLS